MLPSDFIRHFSCLTPSHGEIEAQEGRRSRRCFGARACHLLFSRGDAETRSRVHVQRVNGDTSISDFFWKLRFASVVPDAMQICVPR